MGFRLFCPRATSEPLYDRHKRSCLPCAKAGGEPTAWHAAVLQDPSIPLSAQHYRGVYMLQEKVGRDKNRVDVKKYDAAVDPSGTGLEMEGWDACQCLVLNL